MRFFEYRSERVSIDSDYNNSQKKIQDRLNEWGKDGWEVISVVVPDPRNYNVFVATAKREIISQRTPATGRKFR